MNSSIKFSEFLTSLDWLVFALVLIITFASVVYGNSRKRSTSNKLLDHLIMGRQLTLPMFVATLVATWYGGIFGVTQISFEYGIYNFLTQGIFWYAAYIIFALFLVHKIQAYQAVTLPDLVEKMFGPKSGYLSGIFNFFNVVPIAYSLSLGFFLQILFGGDLSTMTLLGLVIVIAYSLFGGLRAVIYSDLIQFFVMCLGVFLVLVFSLSKFGGVSFLQDNLPQTHFSPLGGNTLLTTFVWGFIALSTLVDPNFYQRCFAAKSEQVSKKGILLSTVVWFGFDICTTAGGMYARAVLPEAEPSHAYLTYGLQVLPPGLRGFFLAGILATILSTLDSYLFIAGTTLSHDIGPKRWRKSLKMHYAGVIFAGLLAYFLSLGFKGDIKSVWKTLGSYSSACLLFPVMYGYLFPGKIKDGQFVGICLWGVVVTTYWRNIERIGVWKEVDELYLGVLATSSALLLATLYNSYFSKKKF